MGSEKLTKAQRAALEWVGGKAKRPWSEGRRDYPKMVSLEILTRMGLIKRTLVWPYPWFELSDLGRSVLSTTTKGEGHE